MATIQQRKLVHKQFNSPIGLYSDENVKATLDRELKAFTNGNVGIETHDQHKPANLANSAVLKMLEEEEGERVYPVNERKSRPRQREIFIDRDTVLKINRRRPYHNRKRDFSWPPPPYDNNNDDDVYDRDRSRSRSKSRCCSEEIRFDDTICKRHEIYHLKEMFDKGTIYENKENNIIKQKFNQQQSHDDNIINSKNFKHLNIYDHSNTSEYRSRSNSRNRFNNNDNLQSNQQYVWPLKDTIDNNVTDLNISKKTYYMPEKLLHDIGIIEPKLRYFERAASSSPDRYRLRDYYNMKTSPLLKRWKSNDEFSQDNYDFKKQQQQQRNYDNSTLEYNNKCNSFNELPPLKPKRENYLNKNQIIESSSTKDKKLSNINNNKMYDEQQNIKEQSQKQKENFNIDENLKMNIKYNKIKSDISNEIMMTVCKNCLLKFKNIVECNSTELATAHKISSSSSSSTAAVASETTITMTKNNEKIDNCHEINNKNKFNNNNNNNTPAIKILNDSNNKNDDDYYYNDRQYCCHCGKITYEYKIIPQTLFLKMVDSVINYDLARNTNYDAKNICSHNIFSSSSSPQQLSSSSSSSSTVKINENINNISKNNCVHVDEYCFHLKWNKNDKNENQIQKNNKKFLENVKRLIEISPEEKEKMKITTTTTTSIPQSLSTPSSVIKTTGYQNNITETNLKGKSTITSENVSMIRKPTACTSSSSSSSPSTTTTTTTIINEMNGDGKHGNQNTKRDENLQSTLTKQENITFFNITRQQGEIFKDTKQNDKIYDDQEIISQKTKKALKESIEYYKNDKNKKKLRRHGIYFTDGEYLWGPYEKWPFQGEQIPDILKRRIEEISSDDTDENCYNEMPMKIIKKDNNNNNNNQEINKNNFINESKNKKELLSDYKIKENEEQNLLSSQKVCHIPIVRETDNDVDDKHKDSSSSFSLIKNENLEAKQRLQQTQKSIIEDLRQIDEYMETAEQALNDAERQISDETQEGESCSTTDNILVYDAPLQDVIKDIFNRKRLTPSPSSLIPFETETTGVEATTTTTNNDNTTKIPPIPPIRKTKPISHLKPMKVSMVENSPIVEQVLLDLYNISMAFDTLNNLTTNVSNSNNIDTAAGISGYCIPYLKDNHDETTSETHAARITELPVVVCSSDENNIGTGLDEVTATTTNTITSTTTTNNSLSTNTSPYTICADESVESITTSGTESQYSSPTMMAIKKNYEKDDKKGIKTTITENSEQYYDKIIESKNILSGFLITKQNQEEAFSKAGISLYEYHPSEISNFCTHAVIIDINNNNDKEKSVTPAQCCLTSSTTTFGKGNSNVIDDLTNGKTFQQYFTCKEMTNASNDPLNIDKSNEEEKEKEMKIYDKITKFNNNNKFSQNDNINIISTSHHHHHHTHDNRFYHDDIDDATGATGDSVCSGNENNKNNNNNDDDNFNKHQIHEVVKSKTDNQLHFATDGQTINYAKLTSIHSCYDYNNKSKYCVDDDDDIMNKDDKLIVKQYQQIVDDNNDNNNNDTHYDDGHSSSSYLISYPNEEKYQKLNNKNHNDIRDEIKDNNNLMSNINKENKLRTTYGDSEGNHKIITFNDEMKKEIFKSEHHESVQQNTNNNVINNNGKLLRSISQPPPSPKIIIEDTENSKDNNYYHIHNDNNNYNCHRPQHLIRQYSFDDNISSESRYYASPSLYMPGKFEPAKGYKKVAWPPVSDNLRIRTPTPQPQGGHFYQPQQQTHPNYYSQQQDQSQSQNHQQQYNHQYHQPPQQQQQQQSYHQQQPQQGSSPYQNQPSPQQLYQQQYQRSNSNPPPSHQSSSTASFCGGIPVRESRSPAPPGYQRQKTPVPQQHQYQQPPQQQQQQQSYHQQQPQQGSSPYQNQPSPQQLYQQQYQRSNSNPPPSHQSSSTASFCGGIPVRESRSPAPPGYQRQKTPVPQQHQYQQPPQQQQQYHRQQSQQESSYQNQQNQQYHHQQQHNQLYQKQYQRTDSNPHPSHQPSSTVSFSGGMSVQENQSPVPPGYQRQNTPIAQQSYQSQQYQQSQQQMQQYQQQQQPFSPSSQGPQSPLTPPAKGWSHVRGPTPTHTSYSQVPSTPQYYQNDNIPHGSSSYDTQFGAGQQNQYYNQPPQSNQQQQSYNSPVVSHYQQPSGQQYLYNQQPLSQSQPQQQYNQPPQQYNQPQPQYYHPQGQQQHPQQQQFDRGQSPGIITLRKEAPISQKPAPVFHSQPAAERFRGGTNMRGDLKWPPPEVKAQMAAENEERIRIAKSPAFRPKKVHKDYSQFFAKHALNNMYPGYKVPPGTQHVYVQY